MTNQQGASEPLVSMLYRSRATVSFGETDLYDLVDGARDRNRHRQVTSALFFERGKFFQWLEGPRTAVDRLFDKIGGDPRHTDVEIVSAGPIRNRVFSGWNLRLFRDRPSIPGRLPLADPCPDCSRSGCAAHHAALDLARGDDSSFSAVLEAASGRPEVQVCLGEQVLYRHAELWAEDACGEAEITIGQALALAAIRRAIAPSSAILAPAFDRRILVTSLPGEPHYMRAVLATHTLKAAGYPTDYLPALSKEELSKTLAKTPYFGIVIVAGHSYLREREKLAIQEICDLARAQSGSMPRVAVYGRLEDQADGLDRVSGADRLCASALRLPAAFRRGTAGYQAAGA